MRKGLCMVAPMVNGTTLSVYSLTRMLSAELASGTALVANLISENQTNCKKIATSVVISSFATSVVTSSRHLRFNLIF
jgi:hypothetical protein